MKSLISIVTIIALSVFVFFKCDPRTRYSDGTQLEELRDIDEQKEQAAQELLGLKNDIDRRLDLVENQLKDTSGKGRRGLEDLFNRLGDEKEKVEESLTEVEHSTLDAWSNVKARSHKTFKDARNETERIGEKIEYIFKNNDNEQSSKK